MAAFEEHCRDCERLLGYRCEHVNQWLDAMYAKFGANHRFFRHHWRGVKEAESLFGSIGRGAAIVHILKDCGRVPRARDWDEQRDAGLIVTPAQGMMGVGSSEAEFDAAAREILNG